MLVIPDFAQPVLSSFAPVFYHPTYLRFTVLLIAAVLTTGRRTVSNLLRTAGELAPGHPSSYHRVLSRRRWSSLQLARILAGFILDRWAPDGTISVVGDDTVDEHRGAQVYGKGCHRDPVRSTHSYTAYRWGHKWVVQVAVLDVQPADRHLLLLVRDGDEKQKFLCGHDERHWFVAAVPESAPVGTVRQAKEALKPAEVQAAQGLRAEARDRRKNAAYRRQGEWFFLPVSGFVVDEGLVLRNEPLRRGDGGKPHWCEFCYRTGGETVHVCARHPNGVSEKEYRRILTTSPRAKGWGWRTMLRNPGVYVRGKVRHADHKTIVLHGWHRVLMNTENQARAMRNVAFLD